MKKIFKKVLFLTAMFFIACSEDIYLHNGFSSLVYFDQETKTKIYYLDLNRNLFLDKGDSILYQETKDDLRIRSEEVV